MSYSVFTPEQSQFLDNAGGGSSGSFNPNTGGIVSSILNFLPNLVNNERNWEFREKENAQNQIWNAISQQNYREQMDFQKLVYGEQKEREDTAIQRRVRDMQAAGLNPVNALGANASASASTVASPHFGSQGSSPLQLKSDVMDNAIQFAQLQMQKSLTDANVKKINSEALLNNARTNDVVASEDERRENIKLIRAKTGLTGSQADEISERINLIRAETEVSRVQALKITQETDNLIAQNKVINQTYKKLLAETNKVNEEAFEKSFKNQVLLMYPEKYRQAIVNEWDKSGAELQLLKTTNGTRISSEVRNWCDSIVNDAVKIRFALF